MVTMNVFFVAMVVFDVLASRFGHDSRFEGWSDERSQSPLR
jgi:hypothetical protein